MFINYSVNTGISIDSYRLPHCYAGDITDLVDDVFYDRNGCCSIDGAKDALEDGEIWAGSNATADILEMIHNAITEYEVNAA